MPVSTEGLNRVALALGYEPGDFTEPRVPLNGVEFANRLDESLKRFEGLRPVSVRPLRTMTPVADILRAKTLILHCEQLGEEYQDALAEFARADGLLCVCTE